MSLRSKVRNTQANIVTIQETHSTQKGKILMYSEFVVFESIRNEKGGGKLVAIHEDLNPHLIEEYSNKFELIVVEVDTNEMSVRNISGYGPQENWEKGKEKRLPFFVALETDIEKSHLAGNSVII